MTSAGLRRAQLWETDYRSSREAGNNVLNSIIATSGRTYGGYKLLIQEFRSIEPGAMRFLVSVFRDGALDNERAVYELDGLFGLIRTINLILMETP